MTPLTRADELYIASCLLARVKRKAKQLKRSEARPMHPDLVKHLKDEVTRCTRLAALLRQEPNDNPRERGNNRDLSAERRCNTAAVSGTPESYSRSDPREDARTPAGGDVAFPRNAPCAEAKDG